MITLTGSPAHIGKLWGQINHRDIEEHLQLFLRLAAERHGLSEAKLIARSRRYDEVVGQLAPHWHEESEAIARTVGVERDLYHALLAGKYRGLLFAGDCTSYAAVGGATSDGRTILHKNRDNELRAQAFYRKQTEVSGPDPYPFLAVGDTSDTGVMMVVNAAGLAASADQAGKDPDPYYNGVMNPYGLRLIAEQAADCSEALELVRMMNDRGLYAGAEIATNWTFADRHGNAMVVYNSHQKVLVTSQTTEGHVVTVEREGLPEFLEERIAEGGLTAADFNAASRLPGVCVAGNCSSFTALIDPEQPEVFTCAWAALGNADKAAYFPLYLGVQAFPRAYMDGTVSAYSLRGTAPEAIAGFEEVTEEQRLRAEAEARTAASAGQELGARYSLETVAAYALEQAEPRL